MKVVIPTLNRPNAQPVLQRFLDIGVEPILSVHKPEDAPEGYTNYIVCPEAQGLRANREFILRTFGFQTHMVIDDDLKIFKRDPDTLKLTQDFPFKEFYDECKSIGECFPLSGVHPRFMINTRPHDWILNSKMYRVMIFNLKKLPPKVTIPEFRLETGQDHDFHLQLLTQGVITALTCKFAHDDAGQLTPGGCSTYRKDGLQGVEHLVEAWPNYVRLNKNGRPVIQFKKAFKDGIDGVPAD
jgi:hypothetical protein